VRYLEGYPGVQEITTIARRGPAEVKFDKKELEHIAAYLDESDFAREIQRVTPAMQAIGQDPDGSIQNIREVLNEVTERKNSPTWKMHFLYSPVKLLSEDGKSVSGLQLEENILEMRDGEVKAKGTGKMVEVETDTVIFAIGDRVNDELGLPIQGNEFVKSSHPKYPIEGVSYEVMDEKDPARLEGVFVGGWSRNASTGMVGITRKDGTNAARAILAYLNEIHSNHAITTDTIPAELKECGYRAVNLSDLSKLEEEEKKQALIKGLPEFKFDTDEEMLKVMGV
jgi:ferredoxin--NADP+ reductase